MDGIDFLNAMLDLIGKSESEVARAAGISQSTLWRYTNRAARHTRRETVERLAKALGVKLDAFYDPRVATQELERVKDRLLGNPGIPSATHVSQGVTFDPEPEEAAMPRFVSWAPVVGSVQAGDDGYLEELGYPVGHGEEDVPYDGRDPEAYALRVRGASMEPKLSSGYRIVVSPNSQAAPGDMVVVKLNDGRKTVKTLLYIRDGEVVLDPINFNGHSRMTLRLDIVDGIHKVVAIYPP